MINLVDWTSEKNINNDIDYIKTKELKFMHQFILDSHIFSMMTTKQLGEILTTFFKQLPHLFRI